MSLRDDLIAAKALIAKGWNLLGALDRITGDVVAEARVSSRSLALVDALNAVRPKRPGRARPTLRQMHDADNRDDLLPMFDRAIASAQHEGHGETETGI